MKKLSGEGCYDAINAYGSSIRMASKLNMAPTLSQYFGMNVYKRCTLNPVHGYFTGEEDIPCEVDGDTIFKYYSGMRVQGILRPQNRCKGMVIYCGSDCIIENGGSISMTARGAKGEGEIFAPLGIDALKTESGLIDLSIGTTGGAGGAGKTNSKNETLVAGAAGAASPEGAGACGGGGSGANYRANGVGLSGAGSAGTTWSGGTGGGAVTSAFNDPTASPGEANGGAGGAAAAGHYQGNWSAGGGAGNPGGEGAEMPGWGYYGGDGETGTGGTLVLLVEGDLYIYGSIIAEGSKGGTGRAGGGSSGGGSITIVHKGDYIGDGLVSAAGGVSVNSGGAGGDGSIRIHKGWIV